MRTGHIRRRLYLGPLETEEHIREGKLTRESGSLNVYSLSCSVFYYSTVKTLIQWSSDTEGKGERVGKYLSVTLLGPESNTRWYTSPGVLFFDSLPRPVIDVP